MKTRRHSSECIPPRRCVILYKSTFTCVL